MDKTINQKSSPIAVIGMGCRYPGASSIYELWKNILSRRQQFRRMPDCRLPLSEYFDEDPKSKDKTYGQKAAVMDGFDFDWVGHRIPQKSYESSDIVHWLALDCALQAITDSGYNKSSIKKERTGVILGNTLTGEESRTSNMRLRWPFVKKTLCKAAYEQGLSQDKVNELCTQMEIYYKSVFPEVTEDSLSGGLSNTIAGRVCNFLDLHGGGYVVDGACSSSLIAIHSAASALSSGQMDMVIAGGVDISLDTFELIGFAKTGALTSSKMAVYDKNGKGFIPGEGCGFVVLKRLEDAKRDGDKIYSVIQGWGISSDGKGGLTAPSSVGQGTALSRAYELAPYNITDIDFIEGHGTGTAVGDKVELGGICHAIKLSPKGTASDRSIGITSFKSIVGHTKAAAGIGAFIKTVIALNQRIIPPTAGCLEPHDLFYKEAKSLYPINKGEIRDSKSILRAGVSAMGFGGINCHVTLESGSNKFNDFSLGLNERSTLASNQNSEIIILSADKMKSFISKVEEVITYANDISVAELVDLSKKLVEESNHQHEIKVAFLATTPNELLTKLDILKKSLSISDNQIEESLQQSSIWFSNHRLDVPKIGFAFPGQGTQQINMSKHLIERFDWAFDFAQKADEWAKKVGTEGLFDTIFRPLEYLPDTEQIKQWKEDLAQTEIAQPAIVLSSLLWFKYLNKLGIKSELCIGHSLGELSALHATGAYDDEKLIKLATIRGQSMSSKKHIKNSGKMVSLFCSSEQADDLLKNVSGYLVKANINTKKQVVISGEAGAINDLVILATKRNVKSYILPVSNAFHSNLVAKSSDYLIKNSPLTDTSYKSNSSKFFSGIDTKELLGDTDIHHYLSKQIVQPVDYLSLVNSISNKVDCLIEVGHGSILTNMNQNILENDQVLCMSLESKTENFDGFNTVLARLFVLGKNINWEHVFNNRAVNDFIAPTSRSFYKNPCERLDESYVKPSNSINYMENEILNNISDIPEKSLKAYLSERSTFISNVIKADIQDAVSNGSSIKVPMVDNKLEAHIEKAPIVIQSVSKSESLLDITASITGFPVDSINMTMRLLDDLNMDSIKSTELLTSIGHLFKVQFLNPSDYANATLTEIDKEVTRLVSNSGIETTASIGQKLLALIEQVTGFPKNSLNTNMKLLDDLNMDSIKSAELMAEFVKMGNYNSINEPALFANASLKEIIEFAIQSTSSEISETNEIENIHNTVIDLIVKITGFPIDSLSTDFSLLDDLNMDSIKSGDFFTQVSEIYDIGDFFKAGDHNNSTIGNIVQMINQQLSSVTVEKNHDLIELEDDTWVRSFTMEAVPKVSPLNVTLKLLTELKKENILFIQADESSNVQDIVSLLSIDGFSVKSCVLEDVLETITREDFKHYVLVLPKVTSNDFLQPDINKIVANLFVAKTILTERKPNISISFIQFSNTPFELNSNEVNVSSIETNCTLSFASSIHHENPNINIRVFDFSQNIEYKVLSKLFAEELIQKPAFNAVAFDADLVRYEIQHNVQESAFYTPRDINLNKGQVVIVTGGAKGVTAECAISFAKRFGTKMALIGSSLIPNTDDSKNEINQTLARFEQAGLDAEYYSCDITDENTLLKTINFIVANQGAIKGVIHGAGINKPRRFDTVENDEALKEISPKLQGAINLLRVLDGFDLAVFIGLTSIIGVTGMPGNAWYAFSNEALNQVLKAYKVKQSSSQVFSIAYSVWDDVGMGVRMGSTHGLAKMGINAIPLLDGIEYFMKLCEFDPGVQQSVVSSRLGGLDTWQNEVINLPKANRYLEDIISYEKGVEVISIANLSLDTDLYLKEHLFNGSYLFPTVFGLEAMAQACSYVLGFKDISSVVFKDIKLERPIVVTAHTDTKIQIKATVLERNDALDNITVVVGISTEQSNFSIDHFSAQLVFEHVELGEMNIKKPFSTIDIDPQTDLYGGILFQGGSFQRMTDIYEMSQQGALFKANRQVEAHNGQFSFSEKCISPLVLGDPYYRDTLLQSLLLSVTGQFLPVYIEKLVITNIQNVCTSTTTIKSEVLERKGSDISSAVYAINDKGKVLEYLEGYKARKVGKDLNKPTPEEIVEPNSRDINLLRNIISENENRFGLVCPKIALHNYSGMHALSKGERHLIEEPIFYDAISQLISNRSNPLDTENISIDWQDNGKPYISGLIGDDSQISLSHDDKTCIAIAGKGIQGCDIAEFIDKDFDQWLVLLGHQYKPVFEQLLTLSDSVNTAGLRLWSVIEAGFKAIGSKDFTLQVSQSHQENILFNITSFEYEDIKILTFPIDLTRPKRRMIAITAALEINLNECSELSLSDSCTTIEAGAENS